VAAWEIVTGSRELEGPEGGDTQLGWAFELERDGERRPITVDRGLALADKRNTPDDVRRALTTRGSSAVVAVLDRERPPRRLVLHMRGIDEIDT
jgi:hypothetical protein